jgi:hypothetical protein
LFVGQTALSLTLFGGEKIAPMASPTARRTESLDHDDYLKRCDALGLSYRESIREYDRLVTWASAGALGLSITFLEKFGKGADSRTAWLLGVGWISLGLSFATSLSSQYASSRIYSWARKELDHLQLAPADRTETWATEAVRLDRKASRYNTATRWLTFMSGVLLVGGIMLVTTFAFLDAPFKPAGVIPDKPVDAPRTTEMTVPEKRGWEYLPEPVLRPQSPPPSKEPAPSKGPAPQEKR